MKTWNSYVGSPVLILGYGISGQGAARLADSLGMRVIPVDLKHTVEMEQAFRSLKGAEGACFDWIPDRPLPKAPLAIISPGLRLDSPMAEAARRAGALILGELEFAGRAFHGRIAAITGTNGKTTTTELTTALCQAVGLKAESAGNIGTALSDAVRMADVDLLIVESSSFQLECVDSFHPCAAAFLNLASDHINRHGSLENYAAVKQNLFRNMTQGEFVVLNANLPDFAMNRIPSGPDVVTFSAAGEAADFTLHNDWIEFRSRPVICRRELHLAGLHNVENVMGALAMLRACAGEDALFSAEVRRCLSDFSPDHHRMECFLEKNGIRYIDDSKATNPHSVNAALKTFGGDHNVILVLGGLDKGMDFSSIREDVRFIKSAVLIGECREKIYAALHDCFPCVRYDSFREAVSAACSSAVAGDVVALCPACASMDMFRDYKDRGDQFQRTVRDFIA